MEYYYFLIVLLLNIVSKSISLDFSRNYTGVSYSPYVCSKNEDGNFPPIPFYTPKHVRVMMQVITQKFSHVLIYGMGYSGEPYVFNDTYHKVINAEGHSAEQAASVNKEMGRLSLTILQGVWDIGSRMSNEVKLALEATQRANNLFPGTVTGIVLTNWGMQYNINDVERSLKYFRIIKNSLLPVEVGTIWNCDKLLKDLNENLKSGNSYVFANFVNQSDFIICNVANQNPTFFDDITKNLLRNRATLKKLNPRIRVMAHTKWSSNEPNKSAALIKFRAHWKRFNNWAEENKFPVYYDEAIEDPRRRFPNIDGWWRLSDNQKINQISGYIEQVPDPYEKSTSTVNIVIWCTILIAIIFAIILLILSFKCVFDVVKNYVWIKILMEFENGLENNILLKDDNQIPCFEALKIPFDKSLQIANAQITLQKKNITQHGHVRSFHEAKISSNEQSKIVALLKNKKVGKADDIKEMLDEAKILLYLRGHPNIITVQGVFTETIHSGQVQVAFEFCNLGSLHSYLKNERELEEVSYPERMTCPHRKSDDQHMPEQTVFRSGCGNLEQQMMLWSHEISSGMDYLDSKQIIHGSLATRNVLLSFNKTAKISGFKLKRRIAECTKFIKTGKPPSMWRWLSVESFRKCEFSGMSDVWSFGVTLWEIFSMGEVPFGNINWANHFVSNLENGLRLNNPLYGTPELFQMLVECWELEPTLRPKFDQLNQILRTLLGDVGDCPTYLEIS